MFRHPDDEESPRFGGWADDFNTYEEACAYYGIETPAQLRAEAEFEFQVAAVDYQDELEASGPRFGAFGLPTSRAAYDLAAKLKAPVAYAMLNDEIPF